AAHLDFLLFTPLLFSFFFFTDPAPTEIYTFSLHDALPIFKFAKDDDQADDDTAEILEGMARSIQYSSDAQVAYETSVEYSAGGRSEEHTSELQSRENLVCRLLLEKKKNKTRNIMTGKSKSQ